MGLVPSKTELYFPSETLRLCPADHRCCCNGRHRSPKYVYVDRDGTYKDVGDKMGEFFASGMMPWKDVSSWNVRDFERLHEVLREYNNRERGRGGGGFPMSPPAAGMAGPQMPMPMQPPPYDGGGMGMGGGGMPPWAGRWELERMRESVEQNFRRMREEWEKHNNDREGFLFGTEQDQWKERYQRNMMKTLQEILPQMMGGGMGMGMGMPPMMGPMMGGPGMMNGGGMMGGPPMGPYGPGPGPPPMPPYQPPPSYPPQQAPYPYPPGPPQYPPYPPYPEGGGPNYTPHQQCGYNQQHYHTPGPGFRRRRQKDPNPFDDSHHTHPFASPMGSPGLGPGPSYRNRDEEWLHRGRAEERSTDARVEHERELKSERRRQRDEHDMHFRAEQSRRANEQFARAEGRSYDTTSHDLNRGRGLRDADPAVVFTETVEITRETSRARQPKRTVSPIPIPGESQWPPRSWSGLDTRRAQPSGSGFNARIALSPERRGSQVDSDSTPTPDDIGMEGLRTSSMKAEVGGSGGPHVHFGPETRGGGSRSEFDRKGRYGKEREGDI